MPKISIIIPIYDVEKYLCRCLDSVLAQTFSDWEAVCVNDGSPDGCSEILSRYASMDRRIVIVDKENGGLSDARNVGLKNASGDFVIFLDSDDFIHPQTMEIALALQQEEQSDIVSWYKDRQYRPIMFVRSKLGMEIDDFRPKSFHKRYDLSSVDYYTTDDVFAHVIEGSGSGIKYPIKHFYVVRHLIRRELLSGVEFVKGLIFEDFPWWSEVILKNPRVTITQLPLYYYYPNFKSIGMSRARHIKVKNWLMGLEYSYLLYQEKGTDYQRKMWGKNCMWPVITGQIASKLSQVKGDVEIKILLSKLWDMGVFDNPPTSKAKYHRGKIKDYIEA